MKRLVPAITLINASLLLAVALFWGAFASSAAADGPPHWLGRLTTAVFALSCVSFLLQEQISWRLVWKRSTDITYWLRATSMVSVATGVAGVLLLPLSVVTARVQNAPNLLFAVLAGGWPLLLCCWFSVDKVGSESVAAITHEPEAPAPSPWLVTLLAAVMLVVLVPGSFFFLLLAPALLSRG